ncbi:Casparian strip membrane protein domain [Dillenia turbinata]|uniref:CASP-like protein n=1 Tax=Dillenia turbinata TaxID=194707 RepID=A0AAN8W8B6_9MAGN
MLSSAPNKIFLLFANSGPLLSCLLPFAIIWLRSSKPDTHREMSNPEDYNSNRPAGDHLPEPEAPPHAADPENPSQPAAVGGGGGGMREIIRRWKREDLLKRGSLTLRVVGLVFSLLSAIIMASNEHGDWKDFDRYQEYRYLLAIAILSTLYTAGQAFRHVHELSTARVFIAPPNSALIDFVGDQVVAYLLISSASSAIPLTNRMREGADNSFTDASSAAISMSFFAFFALAISAIVSGYKVSTQTYI